MNNITDKKKSTDANPLLKCILQLMACTHFRWYGYWSCLQIIFKILERTMCFAAVINTMLIPECLPIVHSVLQLCCAICPCLIPNAAKTHVSLSLPRRSVLWNVFLCGIKHQGNASPYGLPSAISSSCAWPNLSCLSSTWTNVVHSPTTTGRNHMTLHWATSCGRIRREDLEEVALQTSKSWVSNPPPARLYYAARSHICELCLYYKNITIIWVLYHLLSFFQLRPSNQPTITGMALCHKEVGDEWSRACLLVLQLCVGMHCASNCEWNQKMAATARCSVVTCVAFECLFNSAAICQDTERRCR